MFVFSEYGNGGGGREGGGETGGREGVEEVYWKKP